MFAEQIVAELVGRQRLDLAASCLAALLHGELLWAAAAAEDHMVLQGHVQARP